jgi:hypothetical protein
MARPAAAQTVVGTVQLTDVRGERQGDAVTVEITTSGAPKYRSELKGGPFRLVLDFEDATYAWAKAPVAVGADPVKELRGSQYRKGIARVVIELMRKAPYALAPHAAGLRVVFGTPEAPTAAPPQFKLQGIVLRDEGSVETIEERHIVLQTPRGTTEMRLEDPRPVKPAAAPACNGRPPILPSPQPWRGRPV